jgi:hypothetical protein
MGKKLASYKIMVHSHFMLNENLGGIQGGTQC